MTRAELVDAVARALMPATACCDECAQSRIDEPDAIDPEWGWAAVAVDAVLPLITGAIAEAIDGTATGNDLLGRLLQIDTEYARYARETLGAAAEVARDWRPSA